MQSKKFKGQLQVLPQSAIYIVVFIIVVALGILILVGMNDSTTNEDANNAIGEGVDALGDMAGWSGTLVIVIIAGVILSIVLGLFLYRRMTGGSA